ncbi:MAG: DUF6923 family protein [Chitinophagales bacterium]
MKTFTIIVRKIFAFLIFSAVIVTAHSQTPVGCNGQYYISHGPTSGSTGNTLMEKLAFSGGILTPASFPLSPGSIGYNAMGLNPIDGFIYAVRYPLTSGGDQKSHVIKIDASGNETDLGAIALLNNGEICYAGCFDANGDFYFTSNSGTGSGALFKITNANLVSRTATQVTSSGYSSIYDIAINPVDGQMYGTSSSTTTNYLFTINKTTGAISSGVGPTMSSAGFFAALFINEIGNLYGYRSDGNFYLINKTTGALTAAGSTSSYSGADGCSCSFGRVFQTLTASNHNQVCPSQVNQHPFTTLTDSVTNQTSGQKTGLTYTLEIPGNRFSFSESTSTIATNLSAAGVIPANNPALITISSTTGTNNKIVITSFQTGAVNTTLIFTLQIQLVTLGGTYSPVNLQANITGLPANLGGSSLSDDPTTVNPGDPTTITFCQGITLPVSLLSFSGTYKDNSSLLNWDVENQVNFSYYEIQRSINGFDFAPVGTKAALAGADRKQYLFTDDLSAVNGNVFFYRLKMVDIDGKYSYSNVIMIRKDQKKIEGVSVIPNPVINDMATIRFSSSANGFAEIRIIDLSGKVVLRQQSQVFDGVNSVSVNNLGRLQSGIYTLQVADGENIINSKFSVIK